MATQRVLVVSHQWLCLLLLLSSSVPSVSQCGSVVLTCSKTYTGVVESSFLNLAEVVCYAAGESVNVCQGAPCTSSTAVDSIHSCPYAVDGLMSTPFCTEINANAFISLTLGTVPGGIGLAPRPGYEWRAALISCTLTDTASNLLWTSSLTPTNPTTDIMWLNNSLSPSGSCSASQTSSPSKSPSPTSSRSNYNSSTPCPASFYCISGAPVLCPAGSYCPLGSINNTLCPKGTFSAAGASNCSLCPAATYTSLAGSTSCQLCPGGHYCPIGTSSWARLNCGRGNFCPDGSGAPTPCPYQVPPSGGWGALQVQGPAFLVETARCRNHCFWNITSGDSMLSKC